MPKPEKYRKLKNTGHILFWIASLVFALLSFDIVSEHKLNISPDLILKAIILNMGFALSVYINFYLLIPRFLKNQKYIFYTFWLILTLFVASLAASLILSWVDQRNFTRLLLSANFFTSAGYVLITSLAKFLADWIELQDIWLRYNKAERQRLEAELKTLKAQINPHFLFNSLNNIYSLALIKSDKTPHLILKLSDLMRHVLYESRENFIPLKKEISFVTNFIELQRIRLSEQVKIRYELKGEVSERKIMPLIFEPFLDNAFKHGPKTSTDDVFIDIRLDIRQDDLTFEVRNSCNPEMIGKAKGAHGVGLENVGQRLEMLYGSKDYKLDINTAENVFAVKLNVKLK
ncbi:sensor histidine kinase [Mangrovibacterium diazotrophicum]|uniref:GHKL domain-containing protein n=1 Tax=Mangrovibacterium diazotrophicum TaxID=1261403 RepID=A0A419W6Y6_9BACT|nr:histidine kinase [Mangrovibacterium diazotrophicum]RKD91180.1 GHKL domain-containing protein [Mangrovibacterium diazotrophicum]